MSTDELIAKVKQWRREREIDNPYRQLNKVIEELGEWSHEICRDNLDTSEAKDACGDTLVALINLADICGFEPRECLEEAYKEIENREGKTSRGMFIKE